MNLFYEQPETTNGKIAMLSSLYKGYHYNTYKKYRSRVIANHKAFADYNGLDYYMANDNINTLYDFKDIPGYFLGINKWYAMDHLLSIGYDKVLFVDYDSVFLKNKSIDLTSECKLSPVYGTPYYDSVYLLYYCMYKGITFDQFYNNTNPYKFNSGFMLIGRQFFNREDVDEFVYFGRNVIDGILSEKKTTWMDMCNVNYENIMDHTNTTVTPFDEVFLMYKYISNTSHCDLFDTKRYNINRNSLVDENTEHIHFCVNKHEFEEYWGSK